jgi:extracellular elastinolytic metalloproteinase
MSWGRGLARCSRTAPREAPPNTRSPCKGPYARTKKQTPNPKHLQAFIDVDNDYKPDKNPGARISKGAFTATADFSLDPAEPTNRDASVQNLFYLVNYMHDKLYAVGFTEEAGNFQKDNFKRGGKGGDPILAESQNGHEFNNAYFFATDDKDGTTARMVRAGAVAVSHRPLAASAACRGWPVCNASLLPARHSGPARPPPRTPPHRLPPPVQLFHLTQVSFTTFMVNGTTYPSLKAAFGGDLAGVAGPIKVVQPADGSACNPLLAGSLSGAVAVVDRGNCTFVAKALNAQSAGAVAVIVVNYPGQDDLVRMYGEDATVTVALAFAGHTDGESIKAAQGAAATLYAEKTYRGDASFDSDIVFHEYGHGLTGRM